ncbi:MAG: hypothetical protein WCO25_03980 [Candidatus Uhrbacteria bacterium]
MNDIWNAIRSGYEEHGRARREIAGNSDQAIRRAKQAIFALHRDDRAEAERLLKETKALFAACDAPMKKFADLRTEGPYVAALEEFAEAQLFAGYLKNGKLGAIDRRAMDASSYLGGLCDATGEIVRHAMRQVTLGNHAEVARAFETVEAVITYLLDMDLTGYLRTKFDQAKRNLRSLEQMNYDISMRK